MRLIPIAIFVLLSTPSIAALRVTIDPGHGGSEKGAVHGNVIESEIALQVAKKVYRRLNRDKDFKVQILRNRETDLSLEQRVALSKSFNSDLFVSIHANAHPDRRAQGAEFYIQNQLPADEESMYLAHTEQSVTSGETKPEGDVETILFDLKKSHRILKSYQVSQYLRKNWSPKKKKMIRQGPFFVLSQNEKPAILVEVGYLTHPRERKRLTQSAYQESIAKKIHFALKDYAKNMDKLPSSILETQNAKTR